MNNIKVKDYKLLDNEQSLIHNIDSFINLDIKNNNELYFYKNELSKLELNLLDNSTLNIYLFNIKTTNLEIIINQHLNSKINLYYSFINNNDTYLKIISNIKNDKNINNVFLKNISNKGLSKIDVVANIEKSTKDNVMLEKVNVINLEGTALVNPDILCSSFEVEANHENTIGSINNEQLDYLMSKSLSYNAAKELICKGFILDNMNDYMKELINKEGGVNFE